MHSAPVGHAALRVGHVKLAQKTSLWEAASRHKSSVIGRLAQSLERASQKTPCAMSAHGAIFRYVVGGVGWRLDSSKHLYPVCGGYSEPSRSAVPVLSPWHLQLLAPVWGGRFTARNASTKLATSPQRPCPVATGPSSANLSGCLQTKYTPISNIRALLLAHIQTARLRVHIT